MVMDTSGPDVASNSQEAARQLAGVVVGARLSGCPVDEDAVAGYAAVVLGELSQNPPPADDSLAAQLSWATAELTSLMMWIDRLPEALARICTACADISVEALRELAEAKQSAPEGELATITRRARGS